MSSINVRGFCPLLMVFDMPSSLRFYRDVLGFIVKSTSSGPTQQNDNFGWVWLSLNDSDIMLNTLFDEGERPEAPDPVRIAHHRDTALYFSCPDVDAAYEYLGKNGIQMEKPHITHYGFKVICFYDPDGFELVFQWPVNKTQ